MVAIRLAQANSGHPISLGRLVAHVPSEGAFRLPSLVPDASHSLCPAGDTRKTSLAKVCRTVSG
eukprot:scaffold325951_cov22-Prasinocladus_malaysianus.AAC.1